MRAGPVPVRDTSPGCSLPLSPSPSARPGARRRETMAGLTHAYKSAELGLLDCEVLGDVLCLL